MLRVRKVLESQIVVVVIPQEIQSEVSHIRLNGAVGAVIIIENRCKVNLLLLMRFARSKLQKTLFLLTTRIASLVIAI